MIRKRLILCLLLDNGIFVNSRNFGLSHVGNVETILQYLNFEAMDEVVLLNVARDRDQRGLSGFAEDLIELSRYCFVPMSVGGGVGSLADFELLLRSGADKVVINTAALEQPQLIESASERYGSQCVVLSVDVRRQGDHYRVYSHGGSRDSGREVVDWAREAERRGVGEIFLTSIDHDGTCLGYDLDLVKKVAAAVDIPVIASGGVGEFDHLVEGITEAHADAVSAANIFHFIGEGLIKAKDHLRSEGLDFPKPIWNF